MLAKKLQSVQNNLRDEIDAAAEREGVAINTHRKEYISAFCPINMNFQRGRTVAEELGYSLSGVVGYLRRW